MKVNLPPKKMEKPFRKLITPTPREILSPLDKEDFLIKANQKVFLAPKFFGSWKNIPILDQENTDYCTAFGSFAGWFELLSGNMRDEVFSMYTDETAFYIAKKQMSSVIDEILRKILPQSITKFKGRNIKASLWNLNHGVQLPDGSVIYLDAYYRADFESSYQDKKARFRELCFLIQDRQVLPAGLILRGTEWFTPEGRYIGEGRIDGGHLVLLCGYDLHKEVVYFKNSWGEEWGDKGYGEIPLDKIDDLLEVWALGTPYYQISIEELAQLKNARKKELDLNNTIYTA